MAVFIIVIGNDFGKMSIVKSTLCPLIFCTSGPMYTCVANLEYRLSNVQVLVCVFAYIKGEANGRSILLAPDSRNKGKG